MRAIAIGIATILLLSWPAMSQSAGPSDPGTDLATDPGTAPAQETAAQSDPSADLTAAGQPSPLRAFVDGLAAGHVNDGEPVGMIVTVVNGPETLVLPYGMAELDQGEPVTEDTLFRIGSISKTFVWLAVMMLVDEGRLDLDVDVNTYLDGLRVPKKFGEPVTLNDLMAHRAGFEESYALYLDTTSGRDLTEALEHTRPERVYPPGEVTSYSNWGAALAAKIVEDVTGQPFAAFARERLIAPLDIAEGITLEEPLPDNQPGTMEPAMFERLSRGYLKAQGRFRPVPYMHIGAMWPVGGIAMDGGAMAAYMRMLLERGEAGGTRLLSDQAFQRMLPRAFADRPTGPDLAHGFMQGTIAGIEHFGHGGNTTGFTSIMRVAPQLDAGVFVSVTTPSAGQVAYILSAAILRRIADQAIGPPRPQPIDPAPALAERAAGTYLVDRRSFTRFEKLFASVTPMTLKALEDGGLLLSSPAGQERLTRVAPFTYAAVNGGRYHLVTDEDGEVIRIVEPFGIMSFTKTGPLGSPQTLVLSLSLVGVLATTTLIGAWRRQGRQVPTTGVGRLLTGLDLLTALAWLAFFVLLAIAVQGLAGANQARFTEPGYYPYPSLERMLTWADITAILSIIMIIATLPVWRKSGWTLWRKLHHSLFALAMVLGLIMLIQWNVILAPLSRG